MSAFDDEFGLFGEGSDEHERRPTLGARRIASGETVINDVEPEEEHKHRRQPRVTRQPQRGGDPWAGHRRASDLLGFLARKLVQKPDQVTVELFMDEQEQPVIELVVDSDDLGKVIGRSGRVAHALRTVVRATAEGRVSVDILDRDELEEEPEEESDGE